MAKKLYVVTMRGGSENKNWVKFIENVDVNLKGKNPDYGPSATRIVSHHMDSKTIHLLCTDRIKKKSDVTVEEITKETLKGVHAPFTELVGNYFLPYDDYPEIE